MTTYWFKAKKYGWGWYPSTWQGWLVVGVYLVIVGFNFFRIDSNSQSVANTVLGFTPEFLVLTAILIGICYVTGEKPGWHWGDKSVEHKRVAKTMSKPAVKAKAKTKKRKR